VGAGAEVAVGEVEVLLPVVVGYVVFAGANFVADGFVNRGVFQLSPGFLENLERRRQRYFELFSDGWAGALFKNTSVLILATSSGRIP
jgi:hypothetical protein